MKRIFIKTLGCKVNSFDSSALEKEFRTQGFDLVEDFQQAEITLINSCSVTENAEKEARYWLRRYQRENPGAKRVITGCYAQIHSKQIAELAEVDLIVPNEQKGKLVSYLTEYSSADHWPETKFPAEVQPVSDNRQTQFKAATAYFTAPQNNRTRGFLKIQDGCNGFCSYCQIPYARGASRSVPAPQVLQAIQEMRKESPEIVLTGIHLGDWGHDLPEEQPIRTFSQLLDAIRLEGAPTRLRISSLEPSEVNDAMLETLSQLGAGFCQHFHLPLQSGSDRILHKMRRQYTCAEFAESVAKIRRYFPEVQISSDIIPGFPGETDEDFADTLAFIRSCGIHNLHVFPYSQRPQTAALKMPGHLPHEVIKSRAQQLRTLATELYADYCRQWIGQTVEVLWENQHDALGRLLGKSGYYFDVAATPGGDIQAGRISSVKIAGFVGSQTLLGVGGVVELSPLLH